MSPLVTFGTEAISSRETAPIIFPNCRRDSMLSGVEVLGTCFGDAVLTPELVSLGTVLGVAVGHYVSAARTADDEDFSHLVMWKVFLVPFYVIVAGFQYHVAVLTVVDCFEDCFVPFVYPVFSHGSCGSP